MTALHLPPTSSTPFPIAELPTFSGEFQLGPNDSSIKRGDREDTGDNEARPNELGSGPAQPTVDPTSFGGTTSIRHKTTDTYDIERELGDVDGMEIMQPTDGRLGLTNVGNVPADDWAADTGEPNTAEDEP
jgi:hypothetical protein